MAQGLAVAAGLRRVDPSSYGGSVPASGCWGAEEDVDRIIRFISSRGFECLALKTAEATAAALLGNLRRAARLCRPGGFLFFYFAGHGGQRPDSGGEEEDGLDELLLAYDRPVADDELDACWREFAGGVRILVIIDACHSGTVYKNFGGRRRVSPRPAFRPAHLPMKASLIHIGAVPDGERAPAYRGGGAFTLALCEALTSDSPGDYRDLVRRIERNLDPPYPRLMLCGPGAEEFAGEKPFWLGEESPRATVFTE